MKIYNIFGRPEDGTAIEAAPFRLPPPPVMLPATDRLQRNLERTVAESASRAEVLRREIADREAELADVLRAEEAAGVGLEALAGPSVRFEATGPLTDENLQAACGLALETELHREPGEFGEGARLGWVMPDDVAKGGDHG
jgi:hypothetical protein